MKIKIAYWGLSLALALITLVSCKQEEILQSRQASNEVEYRGQEIPLDFVGDLEESEARAAIYDYNNKVTNAREAHLSLPDKVPVRVYIRKKGEEAATLSSVTIMGDVTQAEGKYKVRILGTIKLREENHTLKEGEWEVLAAIGGFSGNTNPENDKDAQASDMAHFRHWVFPTSEWTRSVTAGATGTTQAYGPRDKEISTMMPWMSDWQKLNTYKTDPSKDGYGQNLELKFKPRGILLRFHARNNMVFDIKVLKLEVTNKKQDLWWGGYFDMTAQGTTPIFKRTVNNSGNPDKFGATVTTTISNRPQVRSGQEMAESVYVWAMPKSERLTNVDLEVTMRAFREEINPRDIIPDAKKEDIYLGEFGLSTNQTNKESYSKNSNGATTVAFKTRVRIPSISSKHTYTIYPILTSRLFITESLVRPNVANSNALNNPWMSELGYHSAWGALELYNPTLTPINLAEYGIFRTTSPDLKHTAQRIITHPMDLNKTVPAPPIEPKEEFYKNEYRIGSEQKDLNRALIQPLTFTENEESTRYDGTPMPGYTTKLRTLYDTNITPGKTMLMPGKTIILLDASYVRYSNTQPHEIGIDDVGGIGIQLKKAVEKGYAQAVVALDNAKDKQQQQDFRDSNGPVMYGGPLDSYALVKKVNGRWTKVDEIGAMPQFDSDADRGTVWTSNASTLLQSRHGRDGNARTRMSVVIDPAGGNPGGWWFNAWVFSPSIEDNNNDFINRFCTLGSRFWLGPTEKSKENEWSGVPNFKEPKARNWSIDRRP